MKSKITYIISMVVIAGTVGHADIILSDFNGTGMDYAYGSWSGALTTGASFLTIDNPANPSGGSGITRTSMDLNATNYVIRMTARLGANNTASQINVVLKDKDATGTDDLVYFLPASNFNTSTFTTIDIPVTSVGYTGGDGDTLVNFDTGGNGLVGWEIQGNYANTSDTVNFEIDSVTLVDTTAVPEPGSLSALLLATGLISLRRIPIFQ